MTRIGLTVDALRDLTAATILVPVLGGARRPLGPARVVRVVRWMGRRARKRAEPERRRLQRVIGLVDRVLPGGPNCYRRSLVELALDSGAASEPLWMGLSVKGGPRSGHAWLGEKNPDVHRFDVYVEM